MRTAIALPAAKFSVAISLAIGLSVLALASSAVAQDATKADAASAAPTKQSDASSDHHKSRAERRAEAAKADAKPQTLDQFPKADGATATAANTPPAKTKMECRTQEVTGSRMGKRICATPEQWAQADEAAAETVRQMRSESAAKSGQAIQTSPYRNSGL